MTKSRQSRPADNDDSGSPEQEAVIAFTTLERVLALGLVNQHPVRGIGEITQGQALMRALEAEDPAFAWDEVRQTGVPADRISHPAPCRLTRREAKRLGECVQARLVQPDQPLDAQLRILTLGRKLRPLLGDDFLAE